MVDFYHCRDFFKNFIVSISLYDTEFHSLVTKITNDKLSVNELFIKVTNLINKSYCFSNKKWNNVGIEVCKRNIDENLLVSFEKVINFSFDFSGFNANSIKHYFLPTKYNFVNFNVADYLNLNKPFVRMDFGNFEGLEVDIEKTQEKLIEFNNYLVGFINKFVKNYRFVKTPTTPKPTA